MVWIAAIALPFIAALQRYAVAYGYEGESRAVAWHSAKGTFLFVAIFDAAFVAAVHP